MTRFLAALAALLLPSAALSHEVTLDTSAARAMLEAVANPALSEAAALEIARMPASTQVIRKAASTNPRATEDRFIQELLATSRGAALPDDAAFSFARVKRDLEAVRRILADFERDQAGHVAWVRERVMGFSPPGAPLQLKGHMVVGSNATGFAFGGNDFYLNISHFVDDMDAVRANLAHELYHAVQGAGARAVPQSTRYSQAVYDATSDPAARRSMIVDRFLSNLLTEGTAMLVGDPALLQGPGRMSRFDLGRLQTQQGRMDRLAIQLDLSLIALTAPRPVAYERAYALGFYGPDQPLYYLGYTMAKAIAEAKGSRRISELAIGPGCGFATEYIDLTQQNPNLLKLGEDAVRIINENCIARRQIG